jgi:hypothetical protein
METETAKIDLEGPDELPGLPAFLAMLEGLIDARAFAKLADLGSDYTETMVTLRTLDGAREVDRFGPVNLSNFEPDFIRAAADTTGGGRVSVELTAPGARPWRFLLDLPEVESEPEPQPAPVAAPAPAVDVSSALARLAESQAQLLATVNQLAGQMAAQQMRASEPSEDAELAQALRDVKREVMTQALAAVKGEDTRGRARVREYLGEFRELIKDFGGVKQDLAAAAVEMGAVSPDGPEVDPVELAERAAGAFERVASGKLGSRIIDKFFPDKAAPDQKQLTGPEKEQEVSAAYG